MINMSSGASLIGLTRALARELGSGGITMNSLVPGAVETEIQRETVSPSAKEQLIARQCIKRGQTPDDLVGMLLFLSSGAASFVTGQSLAINGGTTFL